MYLGHVSNAIQDEINIHRNFTQLQSVYWNVSQTFISAHTIYCFNLGLSVQWRTINALVYVLYIKVCIVRDCQGYVTVAARQRLII